MAGAIGIGLAAAGGVAIALAFKSWALDPALQAQTRGIGKDVAYQITNATTKELYQSKNALEKGIADIKALPLGGLLYGDQVNELQAQLDAVNAKLDQSFADMPKTAASAFDRGWSSTVIPTVKRAAQDIPDTVKTTLAQVPRLAGKAGADAINAFTSAVEERHHRVENVFDSLKTLMKNALLPSKRIARDAGYLASNALAKAFKDKRGNVRHAAGMVTQEIESEITKLIANGGHVGKKTMKALRKALHSENPEVRAAAQRIIDIINGELDKGPDRAGKAGTKTGKSFVQHVRNAVSGAIPVVIHGRVVYTVSGSGAKYLGGRHHASGGHVGGQTWVGESGPELVDLPAGSYVHNTSESMRVGNGSRLDVGSIAAAMRAARPMVTVTVNAGVTAARVQHATHTQTSYGPGNASSGGGHHNRAMVA